MRRSFAPPVLLAVVLLLAACGARVDDSLRQQAAAGQLGGGGGGGTGGTGGDVLSSELDPSLGGTDAGTGDAGTGAVGGDAGTGDAGAGGTAGGDAGAGPAEGGDGGTDPAATAPEGGNGGATDVGVTGTEIKIGTVADLSGPVPGLFQGATIGTQAYVAKINSEGGVFGRKLKVEVGDGQLDCGQNKARHADLAGKVFAFVGSFSLYDDCGTEAIAGKPIPDVHNALGQKTLGAPNNFSVAPLPTGWRTGPLQYYKSKYGAKFTKVGSIYAEAGGAGLTWKGTKAAIASLGGKVIYERAFGPTDTDFTADIVRMRNEGVQMIYITASDAPTFVRILKAARSQNVDWPIIAGGIAYDEGFLKAAGGAAEGVINDQQYAQFFNADDAATIPAVKDFQTWTARVAPGKKRDVFALFGWSSAQLFVDALKAAGPKATRQDVIAALKKVNSFDANGLIAPANPAGKAPATCYVINQVKGGKFVRLETPASAFRCDGGFFRA